MNSFERELQCRLDALRDRALLRDIRRVDSPQSARIHVAGRAFLNFSSNDYLGLANDPALKEAAVRAVERFGAGSGASRLVCGSLAPHHELEETLAAFKGTEAALTFSSGYAAALGTICALLGKDDVIVLDRLVHASIVDAARMSGARLRVFPHNDLNALERTLKQARARHVAGTRPNPALSPFILVATESVFSMDGDTAPLREMTALKDHYGAWLMVDEAHATGLYGTLRRGVAEEAGVSDRIEIQMGTLGKALGASGGYVCGSRRLIEFLANRARPFAFSTAPVPAAAAAANAAVHFVQSPLGDLRRDTLWTRVAEFARPASTASFPATPRSAIIPLIVGSESEALTLSDQLQERGLFIPAIRYPTVARGSARLRITITAAHTAADVALLTSALETLLNQMS